MYGGGEGEKIWWPSGGKVINVKCGWRGQYKNNTWSSSEIFTGSQKEYWFQEQDVVKREMVDGESEGVRRRKLGERCSCIYRIKT